MPSEPGVTRIFHLFSTFAVGGPQRRFADLVDRLGDRFVHTVCAMDGNYDCRRLVPAQGPVTYQPLELAKGAGLSLRNMRAIRAQVRAQRADVLVTYNWGAIEGALANRVAPVARHVHVEDGFGPDESQGRQLRRRIALRRAALSGQTRVIVPSKTLETVATQMWGLSPQRVVYIPNGIDCQALAASADARRRPARPDPGPTIVTLATLRAEKNLPLLLDAFQRLATPDVRLVIAGDGPERARLQDETERRGLTGQVSFPGFVAPAEVLAHADVFALSSDTEQMPYSVIEAMASGLPIAATAVGDVPSMVSTANRDRLVSPRDPTALARAIDDLLSDAQAATRIGSENRSTAFANFDLNTMACSWMKALSQRHLPKL